MLNSETHMHNQKKTKWVTSTYFIQKDKKLECTDVSRIVNLLCDLKRNGLVNTAFYIFLRAGLRQIYFFSLEVFGG